MWRAIVVTAALAACGDNHKKPPDDASIDAPPDGSGAVVPCLDRPTNAVQAPGGGLPCELISPAYQR